MSRPPASNVTVPPGADTVLVRLGEVGTKSERVRYDMQGRLGEHLEALLDDRGIDGRIEHRRNRPLIRTEEPVAATAAAADAMGVVSASPTRTVAPELDAITDALADLVPEFYDGGTFAIDARRRDDPGFTSPDVEEVGGAAVWEAAEDAGVDPEVDLDDPDVTVHVEVDPREAFVFLDSAEGPGGLPLGSQRPLVALLSGGIDSPVAAYEGMRRGAPVTPVYFDLGDFGGPDHVARATEAARTLARHAPNHVTELHVVDAGEVCVELAAELEQGRMLVFRRFMYRAAAELASSWGAAGLVTGEAIGQKSSQTTQNLSVLDGITDFPIHRPLLTRDKEDIMARAEEIGTYAAAEIEAGCNRFAPDRVETRAGLAQIADIEPDWLVERAIDAAATATTIEL